MFIGAYLAQRLPSPGGFILDPYGIEEARRVIYRR